jgi:hypothetical protein
MFEKTKPNNFPEIIIKNDVYNKINAYADLCSNEISALGSVHINNNNILIDDIYLFEQSVSGSSTVLSPESISKFMCDYIRKGKDPSALKFWWHSHVNMETFWSGTDTNTINGYSSDWMISMVSNKRGDFKIRFDIHTPFRMYVDNLQFTVGYDKSFNPTIQKEIDMKVKRQFFPEFPDLWGGYKPNSPQVEYNPDNRYKPQYEKIPATPTVMGNPVRSVIGNTKNELPYGINEIELSDYQTIDQLTRESIDLQPSTSIYRRKSILGTIYNAIFGRKVA